ncbi:MAG: BatD family protein, partial [Lachnospiraceae bacterium]|nr:BatD family protein [Lachnospiraceae bacterium]
MCIKNLKYNLILLVAYILMLPSLAHAASIKITQSGTGEYSVGQEFTVLVEAQGVNGLDKLPGFRGCDVIGTSNSMSTSITSGPGGQMRSVQNVRCTLRLRAAQPGNFTFGPISVGNASSNTISYKISGSASSPATSPSTSTSAAVSAPAPNFTQADRGEFFVKAAVSNTSPYVQEAIIYTVRLYSRVPLYGYPEISYPKMNNCVFEEIQAPSSRGLTTTMVNGIPYECFELYSLIVYPSKSGELKIDGGDVIINSPGVGRIGDTPNTITLNVKDLPNYQSHPDINGVGNYKVSAKLQDKTLRNGEPAHITFTIKGTGNPAFVSLPDIQSLLPEGVKLIKTDSNIDKKALPQDVDASVKFDCTIVASKPGDYVIPHVEFTFFNPKSGKWYNETTAEIHLKVAQGTSTASDDEELTFITELQPYNRDGHAGSFYITSLVYWLWYIIMIVIFTTILIVYRKRMADLANGEALKRKNARNIARKRLRAASSAMKSGNQDIFF